MGEQQRDDLVAALVGRRVEAERVEALVAPDQLGRRVGEQVEEALVGATVERLLQVLDDVELDAALAQDVQRAARFASTGVVVDEQPVHRREL